MDIINTDIVIVGSGVAGLISALTFPDNKKIVLITKKKLEDSNSYLAQGGISVLKDEYDRTSYIEDTLKAGHYKNNLEAVNILVENSRYAIETLENYGVSFCKKDGSYIYTKEGGHSNNRILYCGDHTGKSIMDNLIYQVISRKNITIIENCTMEDLLVKNNICYGIYGKIGENNLLIKSCHTIIATGGIGGIYNVSTNFSHIRGDGIALARKYNIDLKDMSYIQIHPTSLFEEREGRRFLISESVRGEGGILLNNKNKRFTDELKPRDIVSNAIFNEMKKDNSSYEWLNMSNIKIDIKKRFPKIFEYLNTMGIDPYKENIPIVPAQHYTMGGIKVDINGKTSMDRLYAVGEASCNGVHGKNRLASNSLLETVVFPIKLVENIMNTNENIDCDNYFPIEIIDDDVKKEMIIEGVKEDEYAKAR